MSTLAIERVCSNLARRVLRVAVFRAESAPIHGRGGATRHTKVDISSSKLFFMVFGGSLCVTVYGTPTLRTEK